MSDHLRDSIARTILGIVAAVFVFSLLICVPLRWINPPTSAFMLRHSLTSDIALQHKWVDLPQISPHLALALVAAEDQKFPQHPGFDIESIIKALKSNQAKLRGASTISQQLAKNLYLWPGRSLFRKALEAYFTLLIEWSWPKQRILEVYLNIVEFGPGVYGADAASRLYFYKPPSQLSRYQSALLAAVLPNPKKMSANQPSQYVQKRALEIQAEMKRLGGSDYISNL